MLQFGLKHKVAIITGGNTGIGRAISNGFARAGAKEADTASDAAARELSSRLEELQQTVEEQETEIARLNNDVDGWRRKYEFLSTDAPSAYAADITAK